MKIAVFTDVYLPEIDGVVTSILNSTNLLAKKNHKIKIFAPKYNRKVKLKQHKNISVVRFPSISLPSYKLVRLTSPRISKFENLIWDFKPDIIHIQTPGFLGIAGLRCALRFNLPCIGTYNTLVSQQTTYMSPLRLLKLDKLVESYKIAVHGNQRVNKRHIKKVLNEGLIKKIVWDLTKRVYDKCDLILVPSKTIKRELIAHGFTQPIKVVSNGIDLNKFFSKKRQNKKHLSLLHVGRISYEKNIDVLIRSFKILLKKYPSLTLTIVGDGPALNNLKKMVKRLNLTKNIIFTGTIPNSKLCDVYNKHDIFLTASTMETLGLVVLEAMACGMPIVGVDKYAIPEIVINGKNGYVVEPFNENEMARKTTALLTHPSTIKKFSKASIKISKKHNIASTAKKFEKLYRKTINNFKIHSY